VTSWRRAPGVTRARLASRLPLRFDLHVNLREVRLVPEGPGCACFACVGGGSRSVDALGWPHNACRIVISISPSTLARARAVLMGLGFTGRDGLAPVRIELRRHLDLWADMHTSLLAAVLVLA
jgi:hypothetical protein